MSFSDYEEMSVTGPEQEEGADLMDLMALTDNPAGCAIRQEEEQDIQNELRKLLPKAVQRLSEILNNDNASEGNLMKAIAIIFDRAYGRPGTSAKVASAKETMEEAEAYVAAIVRRAREKLKEETQE